MTPVTFGTKWRDTVRDRSMTVCTVLRVARQSTPDPTLPDSLLESTR